VPKMHPDKWQNIDSSQNQPLRRRQQRTGAYLPTRRHQRKPDGREEFKCGHCRAFIGPTVSGGRHRNHCPLCLYSRHVDRSFPGDRASDCRCLMEAVGAFSRPDGEQMIVHRCLGCETERQNRIAADDNPHALLRLLPIAPPRGKRAKQEVVIAETAS
jgi:RNHCP domain-containing protein